MKNLDQKVMEYLREVDEMGETQLERVVAGIILDECEDHPVEYINNVMENGCVSGTVSSLIYYNDTKKFFINNMDDIFNLFNEDTKELGSAPLPSDKFELDSNSLAWYGFERVCYDLASAIDRLKRPSKHNK